MTGLPDDFWSRRRAAVGAEAAAEAEAARLAALTSAREAAALAQSGRTDAEILAGLGLKDPDGMIAGDDFAAFLRAEVPQHLRQRALRRLWGSNPVLANLDGLVDYGLDYTDAATVAPGMMTAYQVGRGMAQHIAAQVELAAAEGADAPATALAQAEPTAAPELAPEGAADCPPAAPPPHHMRFSYAEVMS